MTATTALPGAQLDASRMPGHWLLARLGKRVLRPGGVELTRLMLDSLAIAATDDVVEVAPGLGSTTRLILDRHPASYVGVDRDPDATHRLEELFAGEHRRVVHTTAADTGLPDGSASVVMGEAYLTMQPQSQKQKIVAELARVLRSGGRFGLHEVAVVPDDADDVLRESISRDLTGSIKVNVSPLTLAGWTSLLEDAGFRVTATHMAPLHLLEPRRLLSDEGVRGAARFAFNVARDGDARPRVLAMRASMRRHAANLAACSVMAEKV